MSVIVASLGNRTDQLVWRELILVEDDDSQRHVQVHIDAVDSLQGYQLVVNAIGAIWAAHPGNGKSNLLRVFELLRGGRVLIDGFNVTILFHFDSPLKRLLLRLARHPGQYPQAHKKGNCGNNLGLGKPEGKDPVRTGKGQQEAFDAVKNQVHQE